MTSELRGQLAQVTLGVASDDVRAEAEQQEGDHLVSVGDEEEDAGIVGMVKGLAVHNMSVHECGRCRLGG